MQTQYSSNNSVTILNYNFKNSSSPINIPISTKKIIENKDTQQESFDQYSLNLNNFNPSKMSPPDSWKIRLQSRLKNYNFSEMSLNK